MNTIAQLQVNLFCENVESCLSFYGQLGLPEVFRFPTTGPIEHAEVDVAGSRIGLTSAAAANRLADLGVTSGSSATTEVVLWSGNTDGLFDCAVSAGATVITGPMNSPDGRLRYAWVRDPDGHQVKIVQSR
ncbi:VOC family protein [Actinopolymorpha sp. B17G11]|uniref:VOC family protein n=1 Tax=Actinopolymorpha sp. B17G11 TaxID=3160861 RepID=UPI0032E461DF